MQFRCRSYFPKGNMPPTSHSPGQDVGQKWIVCQETEVCKCITQLQKGGHLARPPPDLTHIPVHFVSKLAIFFKTPVLAAQATSPTEVTAARLPRDGPHGLKG